MHQALLADGGVLGGETSGHVLCLDRASTGDAIVSALQVLEVMRRRGCSLHGLLEGLDKVPQKTVSVRVQGTSALDDARVRQELDYAESQLDQRGRVVLRASGTEPVVRVTVEAADAELLEQVLDRLTAAVRAAA